MSINFPEAATFETASLMPPPSLSDYKTPDAKIDALHNFLNSQFVALMEMQSSISSGWLIDTVRIVNLEASVITAGSIFTQTLYVGDDQLISLNGASNTIEIRDEANTLRTRLGDLGSGTTNWGIECWDSAGVLIFSVGDTVFIDGAVITNATITGAKLVNATVGTTKLEDLCITTGKLASASVTNAKINDLSAGKINAGTLSVNGSPGIIVTGSGNLYMDNGADVILEAAASGTTSYLKYYNSAGTSQGDISWNATTDLLMLRALNGDLQCFADGGDLQLYADVNVDILAIGRVDVESGGAAAVRLDTSGNIALDVGGTVCTINALFRPTTNKTIDLGTATLAFDTVFADDFTNVADIAFQNGMVVLEADKVYEGAPGELGEFWLDPNKRPAFLLGGDGNLYLRGRVIENVDFDTHPMFAQYKHIDYHERQETKRIAKEARRAEERERVRQEKMSKPDKRDRTSDVLRDTLGRPIRDGNESPIPTRQIKLH